VAANVAHDVSVPAFRQPDLGLHAEPIIEAVDVSRAFGTKQALERVSFRVGAGQIHALLGPNGAGKTTLVRILTGLLRADTGRVTVDGFDPDTNPKALRQRVGLIPSADRTFYLRLTGLENLAFFARLYGFNRRQALARAHDALAKVGLEEATRVTVGVYSHGMQKRLSVARAILADPAVLMVDEATHDLDPEGSRRVRDLVAGLAATGVAVVWTTQRIEEIRGFADHVTLVNRGRVAFHGTVPALMGYSNPRRYIIHLTRAARVAAGATPSLAELNAPLTGLGEVSHLPYDDEDHYLLSLEPEAVLGEAIAALSTARFHVVTCTEEQSEIEQAFMSLTGEDVRPAPEPE
jgi:ABC-2 type transport system ATP-binding protein